MGKRGQGKPGGASSEATGNCCLASGRIGKKGTHARLCRRERVVATARRRPDGEAMGPTGPHSTRQRSPITYFGSLFRLVGAAPRVVMPASRDGYMANGCERSAAPPTSRNCGHSDELPCGKNDAFSSQRSRNNPQSDDECILAFWFVFAATAPLPLTVSPTGLRSPPPPSRSFVQTPPTRAPRRQSR